MAEIGVDDTQVDQAELDEDWPGDGDDEDEEFAGETDPANFGKPYNDYNPGCYPKWIADGQTDLAVVAEIYDSFAKYLASLATKGWVLTQAVDNGHILTHWGGEGEPPIGDRAEIS